MRRAGGQAGYEGGFVDQYLLRLIYPEAMTREWQIGVGVFVALLNVGIYALLLRRRRPPQSRRRA